MSSDEPVSAVEGGEDLHKKSGPGPVRIIVWSFAGLLVLLTVLVAVTAATLPGCEYCHDSKKFVAQSAAHKHTNVDCVRCHVTNTVPARITYAYNIIFGMALKIAPVNGGPTTAIPDSNCLQCHTDVLTGKLTSNGLSIDHAQCDKGRTCTDCHGDTAHGTAVQWVTTANMNQCLECHKTNNCELCHVSKAEIERVNSGEWAITHGPNWRKTHGMGSLDSCTACHDTTYCARCHGIPMPHPTNFIRSHPVAAQANRAACAGCHKQSFCDDCHGVPMPHGANFTPAHPALVKKKGDQVCLRCHVTDDCTTCHDRHVHPGGASTPPGTGA